MANPLAWLNVSTRHSSQLFLLAWLVVTGWIIFCGYSSCSRQLSRMTLVSRQLPWHFVSQCFSLELWCHHILWTLFHCRDFPGIIAFLVLTCLLLFVHVRMCSYVLIVTPLLLIVPMRDHLLFFLELKKNIHTWLELSCWCHYYWSC